MRGTDVFLHVGGEPYPVRAILVLKTKDFRIAGRCAELARDPARPRGTCFSHITAAFEFQCDLIVENARAGLAPARSEDAEADGLQHWIRREFEAEAMLKDKENYPLVGDVINHLTIGRTAFYRYFSPDRIRELRKQA